MYRAGYTLSHAHTTPPLLSHACTHHIAGDTCTYGGLYCAISSDPGLSHTVKGKDIVTENLRQLCIFNMTAGVNRDKATSMWWDYIHDFSINCNSGNPKFSVTCSEKQMTNAGYSKVLLQFRTCLLTLRSILRNADMYVNAD